MKKIGIITINDYNNYGNRYQNYATQEILKSLGCEAETIVNCHYRKDSVTDKLNKFQKMSLGDLVNKVLQKLRKELYKSSEEKRIEMLSEARIKSFKQFTNENIKETNYLINEDNIPNNLADKYDYFIVGSDQVWNPNFRKGSSIDFLIFAPKHKRIAYSASFGISTLAEKYIENYSLWLSEMAHISVREDAGANIVKDLTGREVDVLIDPTLMLTEKKWLVVAKCSKYKPIKAYLLTYFLGEVAAEINDKIEDIARNKGLEIVHMANTEDEKRYTADPGEFLDYINSSEIFFTDSFHGAAFSILFEKPFIILDRISNTPSMNSRIDTLLSKFKLEDRKWQNMKDENNIYHIDFSHVPHILKTERKKTLDYLKNALDIKDEN